MYFFFTDLHICTFEGEMFAQMWLFTHLRVKCLHKCGWFLMKKIICTFVGCLHISRQNWTFAHLTASCCTLVVDVFFFLDLHIWGRRVCTNVVVCTFESEMFAQMWLFTHLRVKCLHNVVDSWWKNDLHICGMFAHFTSKLNLCTFWRRHVAH